MNEFKFCPNCGNKLSPNSNFCSSCGSKLNLPKESLDLRNINSIISDEIEYLINKSGRLIINIDENKVYLSKDPESFKLKVNIENIHLSEELKAKLTKLSFENNEVGFEKIYIANYSEKVSNNIIDDLSLIFQLHSNIRFDHEDFEGKEVSNVNDETQNQQIVNTAKHDIDEIVFHTSNTKKKKYNLKSIIIIVVLGIIGLNIYSYHSKHSKKTDDSQQFAISPTSENNTNIEDGKSKINDEDEKYGRLIGVWPDYKIQKDVGFQVGYKFVLSNDGKLYFSSCDISEEKLEIGAKSKLLKITEIVWNGEEYVDLSLSDQRFRINKSGDLEIYDQLGKIGVFTKIFIDPTVLKF